MALWEFKKGAALTGVCDADVEAIPECQVGFLAHPCAATNLLPPVTALLCSIFMGRSRSLMGNLIGNLTGKLMKGNS
jgi:hypothetical protein